MHGGNEYRAVFQLLAQALSEAAYGKLGCVVGSLSRQSDDAEDAGDIDDGGFRALQQVSRSPTAVW